MNNTEIKTKVNKSTVILNKLEYCIEKKLPFSLLRFGDGSIKAMHAYLNNDFNQLRDISEQEGIPLLSWKNIIEFWKTSANHCDYIDTPQVYFDGNFWKRTKRLKKLKMSQKTLTRLRMWKHLYTTIGIKNQNYCNPEINFLACIAGKKSLPDILKDKKVCIVTSRTDVLEKLPIFFDVHVVEIVGKYRNQFRNSFNSVVNLIESEAKNYDLWLIAAGELGRIYPGLIKFNGGRSFDIGSVIDVWCGDKIPSRLQPYLTKTIHHPLKFIYTNEGKEYSKYI